MFLEEVWRKIEGSEGKRRIIGELESLNENRKDWKRRKG